MSNNEQFKEDAAQWKEFQSFFERHRAWDKLEPFFSFWKNGKKIKNEEYRFIKPGKKSTVGSKPDDIAKYTEFFNLFKKYCVLIGNDADTAINPLFLAAMQELFNEQVPPPATVSPPPTENRKPVRVENHTTPPYTITQTPPLTYETINQAFVQPPTTPPTRPIEFPDALDIISLFFIPSLCTVASGLTFLLLRHNLNGIMVLLVALAVLAIGICVAKPLFKVFKVDTSDVHLKKAIGLAIVYELVVFLIFFSCDPVWYYHLLVVLCPFLVAAKSFVFIRNDYPNSKFLLTVLLLAVIPVFDVSTFFVYHSSIPPVRNSDIQTQTLSGRSPQKPLPAPDAPSSSTTPTSDEQLLKEDNIFPKEDGSTVALPPGIEWRSQIRKKEKASTSMNLEQKFNEILTKSSNRVAIGNFVVSPFPLSTEGSALAVKITRRRSRLNSAKVAKDAEKQVAEAYQVDHVSYNLKSALRSFFHRYRVPEQQYEYQCVIMKQYVLDMQSQLLLTDLDRDQFRNLKYTLFSGKSSDDAIKGMLDQFEQGKLNICRYEISGRMISYSEKHVLISRTMEKIDFEIQTSMLVEVDMTDRLTGDKKTVKHNLTTRKPASISVDYRRRYLSTARLRFDRSSVFKASSQELARLISEDLKQLTSK